MQRTSATPWAFAFRGMFWAASLFTLVMALITFPHTAEPGLPINDKIQHGLAFATLTTLALLGYRRVPPLRIGERLSFFGAMIEILQAMPVIHRDCDIRDWMADTLAIVAVLGARHLLTAFRSE